MNTTLDPTRDTAVDSSASQRPVWPLPGTQAPNAHLTWVEYATRQAAVSASEPAAETGGAAASIHTPPQQPPVVMDPNRDTAAGQVWPLPATQAPHAHLTWTEWLETQAGGATVRAPERAVFRRAS